MSHLTAKEIRVINHWTVASLQREVKQFSPASAVQACAGYFVISVLNAEIITFVKTILFLININKSYNLLHLSLMLDSDNKEVSKPILYDALIHIIRVHLLHFS